MNETNRHLVPSFQSWILRRSYVKPIAISLYREPNHHFNWGVGCFSYLDSLRAARKTDKTAKERQLHLYDILLIDIMTIPVLTFAVIGVLFILRAR